MIQKGVALMRALGVDDPAIEFPLAVPASPAADAQTAGGYGPLQISWEVRNRFRLFREERDFLLHLESGRPADAVPLLERAIALLDRSSAYPRQRAEAAALLARASSRVQ